MMSPKAIYTTTSNAALFSSEAQKVVMKLYSFETDYMFGVAACRK
jgi:hypothetical protein